MSAKNQGGDLNRTVVNTFINADFGAFASAYTSIVLKGDADKEFNITGFSFEFRLGVTTDVNANHLVQFVCLENNIVLADSSAQIIFPDRYSDIRFVYGNTAPLFYNELEKRFLTPFKLIRGVSYSFVGLMTTGVALTQVATTFLTVYGFEDYPKQEGSTIYSKIR